MEKKDTENMEMKKPEEQAKPKKKKIISVVRPQNATSKEAKEFTKNQGQKKDRPSRGNGALPADGLHCGSDDLHFRRFRFHGSDGPRFFRFHCGFLPDGRFRGTGGLFSVPGSL